MNLKSLWKPLALILVVGVMAADLVLDYRADQASTASQAETDPALAALPVGTSVGERAPDFTGTTLDGENIRLADLRGKTVLVNIFASWCGPCRVEAPHLQEVFSAAGEEVVFVGLNLQETPAAVAGFQQDFGIEFPLVLNEDGRLTELYQPIGLPTSWFIDPDGVVRYVHAGPITSDLLSSALEDVQAGREPNPFG